METKKLSLQEMEMVEGGQKNWGCAATGGLIVTVWAVGFGIVNPLAGAAVGYLGGLAVNAVC